DSRARQPVLLLLTDGQIGNEQAVTEALGGHPGLVVHTFGVDTVVNDALLQGIARRQRGRCVLLRPDEDVPAALSRLGVLLANPVVTGIELPPAWESADGPLPDLYEGQSATCLVRGPADGTLPLQGLGPEGAAIVLPSVNFHPVEGPAVPLLWARRRLLDLERQNQAAPCVSLSKEFNLLCRFTAFIAWDEQQHVAVAQQHLQQPALAPAGWNGANPSDLPCSSFFEYFRSPVSPSFASRKPSSAMGLSSDEDGTAPADWSWEPLFQLPGGDALQQLIRQWISSENLAGNWDAGERLSLLVQAVVGEHPHNPVRQLLTLVQRLPDLLGAGTRWTSKLDALRRQERW
ncbi:MAG: hypothetical protein J0L84_12525, partial [Verrucomicrobia bacterium]|nr:hypothetical protein [Verrucomicrobiota bacterium]